MNSGSRSALLTEPFWELEREDRGHTQTGMSRSRRSARQPPAGNWNPNGQDVRFMWSLSLSERHSRAKFSECGTRREQVRRGVRVAGPLLAAAQPEQGQAVLEHVA